MVGTEKTSARSISGRPRESIEGSLTVYFFQGKLLGLSNETENHEPSDQIEPRVETN